MLFSKDEDMFAYQQYHSARLKDVELLTGLSFFPELPQYSKISLATWLPLQLWERLSWLDGQNTDCSPLQTSCPSR